MTETLRTLVSVLVPGDLIDLEPVVNNIKIVPSRRQREQLLAIARYEYATVTELPEYEGTCTVIHTDQGSIGVPNNLTVQRLPRT